MATRSRKSAPAKRPARRPTVLPAELPERSNRDFERRHGDASFVTEQLRFTSHTRFLARWSAP